MKKNVDRMNAIRQKLHITKKRILIAGTVLVIAISATTVAVVYKVNADGVEQTQVKMMTVTAKQGNLTLGVSGSGTTYVGSTDQTFDVSYGSSELTLTVEELLTSSGSTVSKGDALLRVSTEDVKKLISYYEEQIADANNALKTAKLTYSSNLAQAKYDYESNLMLGDTALLEYEASIDELQNKVDEAKEALNSAEEQIAEYTKALTGNTYYTKYNVASLKSELSSCQSALKKATSAYNKVKKVYDSKKDAYEKSVKGYDEQLKEALKTLQKKQKEYTKKLEAVLGIVDSKENPSSYTVKAEYLTELQTAYDEQQKAEADKEDIEEKLSKAQKKLEDLSNEYQQAEQSKTQAEQAKAQASKEYEEAKSNYEKDKEEARSKLKSLKSSYSDLEASYKEAQLNQETQTLSLNKEYKISKLTYENAKAIYDAAVKDLDADVNKAQETLDDLKASLKVLDGMKNDGVIKASQDGTIYSLGYDAEDELVEGQAVVSYTVPETIDVDITVSQSDIASIRVGDTANVSISGTRGNLEGVVKEIATQPTSSGSVSNVTYTVTIQLDNSEGSIAADTEASVSIVTDTLENVVYVPVNAVTTSGSTSTVKKQDADGTTEDVTVQTGKDNGTYIEITEGLSAGDTCVMKQQ